MKLSETDYKLLKQLCDDNNVSCDKVIKLLDIVYQNEFKNRRFGVQEELKNILRAEEREASIAN